MGLSEKLQTLSLFQGVSADDIDTWLDEIPNALKSYSAGDFLFLQNAPCNSLYILLSGEVSNSMINKEGKQIIIEKMNTIELLAPAFLYASENKFPVQAETITDCEVLVIGKKTLAKWMNASSQLMLNYMEIISDRCVLLTQRINSLVLKSLKDRVINYLLQYDHYDKQNVIAERLGVARPSLNRVLQDLQKEGLITISHGKIIAVKKEQLKML